MKATGISRRHRRELGIARPAAISVLPRCPLGAQHYPGGRFYTSGPARPPLPERPEHVLHDAAVPVVLGLARGVDPHHRAKFLAVGADRYLVRYLSGVDLLDAADIEGLFAGQAE